MSILVSRISQAFPDVFTMQQTSQCYIVSYSFTAIPICWPLNKLPGMCLRSSMLRVPGEWCSICSMVFFYQDSLNNNMTWWFMHIYIFIYGVINNTPKQSIKNGIMCLHMFIKSCSIPICMAPSDFRPEVICDLTGYRKGQVGFRWRTQTEVLSGRGQFSCGHKLLGTVDRWVELLCPVGIWCHLVIFGPQKYGLKRWNPYPYITRQEEDVSCSYQLRFCSSKDDLKSRSLGSVPADIQMTIR